jgi:hypothetical protein
LDHAGLLAYCLVLFLAFDFFYSVFTGGEEKQRSPRIANAIYDHGLAANFDGYDAWGGLADLLAARNIPLTIAVAATDGDRDWHEHLFILGDDHYSADGNRFMFHELAKHLLQQALCAVPNS